MKFAVTKSVLLALLVCNCFRASSQAPPNQVPTFRVKTQLVLVDLLADVKEKSLHTRALLTELKEEDLRVFDNGHETPIVSFDVGAHHETRPVALWLIVQCNTGDPPEWHSGFLRGKSQMLGPALTGLHIDDAVGVAHWCDDGTASVDLPPSHDPDAALALTERIVNQPPIKGQNRSGEVAMQKMVQMIVDNVHQATPQRFPVLLFLYGDHCATYVDEADRIIGSVLESSGIVFGMSDNGYPFEPTQTFRGGQVFYLVHYYSQQTGGQFYSTPDPRQFSAALDYILLELHLRYTIGFKPLLVDGKHHALRVELTKEAKKRFPAATLRFRQEYIPVAEPPAAH